MTDHDILQQYANFVYALALSRTNRASDAEAVFQEVFLTYARKQPTFADERRAKAWFVAVTDTIAQPFAPDSAKNAAEESADVGEEPAPPEKLTAQTERAMAALHAFCAEQSDQRTRGSTARFFLRAGAVAAALVLLVALTPLRSYATEAVRGWLNDIIPVNVSVVSADGCTIELVEARLANEFLYLTFEEDYSEYQNNYLTSFGDTDDSPDAHDNDLTFSAHYAGEISDNKGRSVGFTDDNMIIPDNLTVSDERAAEPTDAVHQFHQYKIYLPGLKQLMNSQKRRYTLRVTVTPQIANANAADGAVQTLAPKEFFLTFQKGDNESVLSTKIYDMDYSYTLNNLRFDFQKLYIGPTESNFVVELVPSDELNGQDLRYMTLVCVIGESAGDEANDEQFMRYFGTANKEEQRAAFDTPAFFNERYFDTEYDEFYTKPDRSLFVCHSRYYMVVTCQNTGSETRYDSQHLLQAAQTGQFCLFDLLYGLHNDVMEDDVLYTHYDQGQGGIGHTAVSYEHRNPDIKYRELSPQEATLGKRKAVSFSSNSANAFAYNINQTFTVDDIHFHADRLELPYEIPYEIHNEEPFERSAAYLAGDSFYLYLDDLYVSGKRIKPYFAIDEITNDYCIKELVFWGEKEGKSFPMHWQYVEENRKSSGDNLLLIAKATEMTDWGVPDKLTLGYVRYSAYNKKKAKNLKNVNSPFDIYTDYVYYNPAIYTPESIEEANEPPTPQSTLFSVKSQHKKEAFPS